MLVYLRISKYSINIFKPKCKILKSKEFMCEPYRALLIVDNDLLFRLIKYMQKTVKTFPTG